MRAALILTLSFSFVVHGNSRAGAQSLREWRKRAADMVESEIAAAGVTNKRVLQAMRDTPRHEFVPVDQRHLAYFDMALPIGASQTISPPFVVSYMTQELDPQPTDRVLEIGTGSGYQAAILSPLVAEVYSIEIVELLARRAERTLRRLDYSNVSTRAGDGFQGWSEAAPFDKIIVTCSPERVPQPLVDQLAEGGRMVVPVGQRYRQNLYLFRKTNGELVKEALRATLFVPMTGEAEKRRTVLPDPLKPTIHNGSFEEALSDNRPAGWHYQRQLELITDPEQAPDGQRFVTFSNHEPGRGCRALQGFAVDGRKVSEVIIEFSVRGRNIRFGQTRDQRPEVVVTFYDERRAALAEGRVGPFDGTFEWRPVQAVLKVPIRAREAILRIGLLGAVGELSLDGLRMSERQN